MSVEPVYLGLYTIWVFLCVESCAFYIGPGQLGKSSAGASVNLFLIQREYGSNSMSIEANGDLYGKLDFVG